jgi:putative inorganic carbon (hco3(-)) transporter
MKIVNYLNRIIEYSFYLLFLLVPLIFTSKTSELFELPKMWLTFTLTLVIASAWGAKMIRLRQIHIQRTPLDIPLILFLIAHIISTIFSIDPHVSLWGYYSRFNGGLLSVISYLLLYYAFISNLTQDHVIKVLKISLLSGLIVALWGIPSHFGYDPTCFIFRGSFDTSCWTEAFKPTIRIFSTLGQPAWLAAYMSVLLPISMAFSFQKTQQTGKSDSLSLRNSDSLIHRVFRVFRSKQTLLFIPPILFYAALTYTDTRGGFIGFWIANLLFWIIISFKEIKDAKILKTIKIKKFLFHNKYATYFLIFNLTFLIFNYIQGIPISQLERFTLSSLVKNAEPVSVSLSSDTPPVTALGGTDSGKIRLFVWRGAIDAWREKPMIGHGVETFAFAYYKHKPVGHNLTTEWDYLYNKAHNEYLNYLATTGILGLGSYLGIIGTFLYFSIFKLKVKSSKLKVAIQNSKSEKLLALDSNFALCTLHFALIAGYISILISNFFGFSVVIINLYFFLIPAFIFILAGLLDPGKVLILPNKELRIKNQELSEITKKQWLMLAALLLTSYFLLLHIINRYRADMAYANGQSLNQAGAYQESYPFLVKAVSLAPNEPVYRDELSINMGTLAAALYLQNEASSAAELKNQAVALNDSVVNEHPQNIVFWKSRVRLFYALAQGEPKNQDKYFDEALRAVRKSRELAPSDAKIAYNLGILLGQRGELNEAIKILEESLSLKPNYRDAHFALALFYDEKGDRERAIERLNYILQNINSEDEQARETLKSWK